MDELATASSSVFALEKNAASSAKVAILRTLHLAVNTYQPLFLQACFAGMMFAHFQGPNPAQGFRARTVQHRHDGQSQLIRFL